MTFFLDNISLFWGILTIVLAIVGCLVNPFFRGLRFPEEEEEEDNDEDTSPIDESQDTEGETIPVSILVTAHDMPDSLGQNLQTFLEQDYPEFQVIVVGEKGDSATEDILKRLSEKYEHLYYTMIPSSSRYMSREKLQITLGVKASKYEWVILTYPGCRPNGKNWLRTMARNFTAGNNLVLGVVLPEETTSGYFRFRHIRTLYYLMRRAQRGIALCTHMANIAFRKSMFIDGKGFLGNLHLVRGELDFIVNKYASETGTAVELSPSSWLTEQTLSRKIRVNRRLYLIASRKYMQRMSSMRVLCFLDHLFPWLSLLFSVGTLIYAALFADWILLSMSVVALLLLLIGRMIIAGKAVRHFDQALSYLSMPFYESRLIWSDLVYKIRYARSDKNDFTSHKL